MKRKIQPKPEPVIPAELLEQAKQSISPDRLKKVEKCSVCGRNGDSRRRRNAVLGVPPLED